MKSKWYQNAWRRCVVDMHIPDWDKKFLSRFNPEQYVQMLRTAGAQSAVIYAQSHTGLFNYPTRIGKQHANLKGRDVLREMIDLCHESRIAVVVYTSLIYDRWAADTHPDWRIVGADGKGWGEKGRYRTCCPNSPYRDYIQAWTEEICRNYDFEGLRFDMTFWTGVCYCKHCQRRYAAEVGGKIPRVIDWKDPRWVEFQRKREAWLAEFAAIATRTVRRLKPEASVEHQASTYVADWTMGVSDRLAEQNDFLQGDFYGDHYQGSFVRKLLYNLSPNRPMGFETSSAVSLWDHTTPKSAELLEAKASAAIADGAAFIFIDAIDPIGTLKPEVYARMGKVFKKLLPYYDHLGGERAQDVAVYFSTQSKCNFADNGKKVDETLTGRMPHVEAAMNVYRTLMEAHLPVGVITRKNLAQLDRHRILILPNVLMMTRIECNAIRDWVHGGGCLYASAYTSLFDEQGRRQKDFMLGDVFGVRLIAELNKINPNEHVYYAAPTVRREELLPGYSPEYPLMLEGVRFKVKTRPSARVLATVTLPWHSADSTRFASIHSTPPWEATDEPMIVESSFGKGRVIYVAGEFENASNARESVLRLLRRLRGRFSFEADAPAAVEVTMFHQPERKRYVVSLVNFQKDLPNIPVSGIKVRIRRGRDKFRRAFVLPSGKPCPRKAAGDMIELFVPRLETLRMIAVEYK